MEILLASLSSVDASLKKCRGYQARKYIRWRVNVLIAFDLRRQLFALSPPVLSLSKEWKYNFFKSQIRIWCHCCCLLICCSINQRTGIFRNISQGNYSEMNVINNDDVIYSEQSSITFAQLNVSSIYYTFSCTPMSVIKLCAAVNNNSHNYVSYRRLIN